MPLKIRSIRNRTSIVGKLALAGAMVTSSVVAQDEENNSSVEDRQMMVIAADDGSGGAPMIFSSTSSSTNGEPPVFTFTGGEGMPFVSGMTAMGPVDPLSLIHNPDIQKEVELVGQQLDDFKKMNADFQKQIRGFADGIRDGKIPPEKMKEFAKSMKDLREEQSLRVKDMLLPHQLERLQQISTQQYLKSAGTAAALSNKALMEQLGLTDEQVGRLKERGEEVGKELKEKMEALQAEAKGKILAELTAEQREKLQQMTGKNYEFKTPEFPRLNERNRMRIQSRRDQN